MAKDWKDDKAYYKVMNLANSGDPIEINVNGEPTFQFEDGCTALIPVAVANALNNAIEIKRIISGKDGEPNSTKKIEKHRYAAMIDQVATDEFKKNGNKIDISSDLEKSLAAQKEDKKNK